MNRPVRQTRTETFDHTINALVRKRAELAGEAASLAQQARYIREKIACVDVCLALFGYKHSPDGIKPVQPASEAFFARGQLKRMILDILRDADRHMTNREIAVELIRLMGWTQTDAMLTVMTTKVKDVTKRLPR